MFLIPLVLALAANPNQIPWQVQIDDNTIVIFNCTKGDCVPAPGSKTGFHTSLTCAAPFEGIPSDIHPPQFEDCVVQAEIPDGKEVKPNDDPARESPSKAWDLASFEILNLLVFACSGSLYWYRRHLEKSTLFS
jgi:hypothetical protein